MDFYQHIWNNVLENIKQNTTEVTLETWIKPLSIKSIDSDLNLVTLEVPDGQGVNLILNVVKERYITYLENAFTDVMGSKYRVVVKVKIKDEKEEVKTADNSVAETLKQETKKVTKKKLSKALLKEKLLNPKYTFENFVCGASNQYAFAGAKAIVDNPGQLYNPFFIYGGSGLGKTHLMHAIGIECLTKDPNMNVLYVSSEMFTNDIVTALQENRVSEIKNKYSSVDVLLIDDIQFLEKKEKTQEEFFSIFKILYSLNKQIVISSDKTPEKLNNMDERLKSRFGYSLVADIQPPDYETRVAILKKKAELIEGINFNDDLYEVIKFISEKFKNNIRDLEGAFNRVIAGSILLKENLDLKFAKKVLNDSISDIETQITPEKIKNIVCERYGIKLSDLESDKKPRNIAYPRQIAMYLVREMTDKSLPEIGNIFGGKHHSTIKYACDKIESELKYDEELRNIVNSLREEIKED